MKLERGEKILEEGLNALKDLIRLQALLYAESVRQGVVVAGDIIIKHKIPQEKAEKLLPKLEVIDYVAGIARKYMSEKEKVEYSKEVEILKKDAIDFKGYIFSLE